MILCAMLHSIICTRLFRGKMHSDWFSGIEILQSRWRHGEKVGYCYPSGLEKTLCKWDIYVPCKWDIYVPLVTKGLRSSSPHYHLTTGKVPLSKTSSSFLDTKRWTKSRNHVIQSVMYRNHSLRITTYPVALTANFMFMDPCIII
jgi:hypothetical protein